MKTFLISAKEFLFGRKFFSSGEYSFNRTIIFAWVSTGKISDNVPRIFFILVNFWEFFCLACTTSRSFKKYFSYRDPFESFS